MHLALWLTTLIFSNEESNEMIKINKSHDDSGLLIKGVTETVENEVKQQNGGFLGMLATTLDDSLLGNMLARKGVLRAAEKNN